MELTSLTASGARLCLSLVLALMLRRICRKRVKQSMGEASRIPQNADCTTPAHAEVQ